MKMRQTLDVAQGLARVLHTNGSAGPGSPAGESKDEMIAAARKLRPDRERIIICKAGPPEAIEQALMWSGRNSRVESVSTLAEAITLCLEEKVHRLVVNMFSITSSELTALMLFRDLRPGQHVVVICSEDVASMLAFSGLADECHAVLPQAGITSHRRRATA